MGHCYHHALSSVKKWGGAPEDYMPLHQWFDESKAITADFRHRALRHHAEGTCMLERFFGPTITISTATFTPNFDNAENFTLTLVHASCPCTLANPSTSLVAGQSGVFEIHQSSTGSDTIGTWGSDYQSAGGTASITLSTGASAVDYLPYYVNAAATAIILGSLVQGPTH